MYEVTASYGHFGRVPYEEGGIEYFTWEKLDYVDILKEKFRTLSP
jgi:S-adenosylmethionine synthetase